jgi:hypothetical protein
MAEREKSRGPSKPKREKRENLIITLKRTSLLFPQCILKSPQKAEKLNLHQLEAFL